jgi:hypothetical protein
VWNEALRKAMQKKRGSERELITSMISSFSLWQSKLPPIAPSQCHPFTYKILGTVVVLLVDVILIRMIRGVVLGGSGLIRGRPL